MEGCRDLHVPPKVKHMIWRASYNAIPTLCNLWRRNVMNSVQYSRCQVGSEDTVHDLLSCPALYVIWEGNEVLTKLWRYKFDNFVDLLGMIFMLKEHLETNQLAMIFQLIWRKRSSDRCGEKMVEIIDIRRQANSLLQDFSVAQKCQIRASTVSVRAVRWIPPIMPQCNINFDGACFSTEGVAGLDAVIHDASGQVRGALAQRIKSHSQQQQWRPWLAVEL